MLAVGLMSGTSLDGVDAALVEISGVSENTTVTLKKFITVPFTAAQKARIQKELANATSSVEGLCSLDFALGEAFGRAVLAVCREAGIASTALAFVASHGQTLYHLPVAPAGEARSTMQLGNAAVITEITHTTVVSDFRSRDLAAGGQGAPIVPYSEYVLYRSAAHPRILQNIGGIGNATVIKQNARLEDLFAFDTGPGNMVIDELCRHFFHEEYDAGGKHAAAGHVNQAVLHALLKHPYFAKQPPKTTGRELFGKQYTASLLKQYALAPNDWLATATALTAQSIIAAVRPFAPAGTQLIVGGGGSYNPTLLKMMQAAAPTMEVLTQEELGMRSDAKEAIAMTILGNQTLHHLPSNVPSATGASRPVILGSVTYYD
ncbi:anhydro-N-acetylmuramic acid kinase AnmK [Lacticaseibacillus jixianensis]|uniref:Anhydro-N-acetylmuramic acid kinase n=1 Tax=Lacticaseibacillus jixianensis TaxID=2486012 RepID=A0ABW4B952_9LACO|nr:anhydro-N-acetylmuramic acid kinase AnmK [Lacticaseibacillus jixianensis]